MGVELGQPVDRSKLTIDQVAQLDQYEASQKQLRTLQEISSIIEGLVVELSKHQDKGQQDVEKFGALLTDIRTTLSSLDAKEAPESPDYAKPVVDAVKGLEMALTASLKAINIAPQVNVDAPEVNVPAVDLSGVEKAMGSLPAAFKQAIKLIPEVPQTDFTPLLDAWTGISQQLASIETATRLKPIPGSIKVSNLSEITSQLASTNTPLATRTDSATTTNVTYVGKAAVGTATSAASWQIFKMDETTANTLIITWSGSSSFNQIWDNRASLSYS